VIKILSLNGRRAAKRSAESSSFGRETAPERIERTDARKETPTTAKQERIIDFETLLSWYNEQNSTAADGNELSALHIYERKQRSLKFL